MVSGLLGITLAATLGPAAQAAGGAGDDEAKSGPAEVDQVPSPTAPAAATDEVGARPRLLVLDPKAVTGEKNAAKLVGSILVVELGAIDGIDVTSTQDLARMLEVEAERQALGCGDTSCLAELAGAMGASLVVYSDLGRLGERYVLTLNLFDSDKASAVARTTVKAPNVEGIADGLRPAIVELMAPTLKARGLTLPDGYVAEPVASSTAAGAPAPDDNSPGGSLLLPASMALAGGGVVLGVLLAGGLGAVGYIIADSSGKQSALADNGAEWESARNLYYLGWVLYIGGPVLGALAALAGVAAMAGGGALIVLGGDGGDE